MKILTAVLYVAAVAMLGCGIYTASLGAFFTTLIILVCAVTTAAEAVALTVLARRRIA